MAEKILNTRIQLKYDTLANWTNSDLVLKAGELAIVRVGEMLDGSTHANAQYPVLFKVGDGNSTFAQLPYASALAADVYAWAKAKDVVLNTTNKSIEFKNAANEVVKSVEIPYITSAEAQTLINNALAAYSTTEQMNAAIEVEANRAKGIEADLDERLEALESGDASVSKQIENAIAGLDANVSQTAGADGLALNVVEVDGVITSISGSIAAETYDAFGAASAAQAAAIEAAATDATSKANKALEDAKADATAKASAAQAAAEATAAADATSKANAAQAAAEATAAADATQKANAAQAAAEKTASDALAAAKTAISAEIDADVKEEADRAKLAEQGLSDRIAAFETGDASVDSKIDAAVKALDSNASQTAGADGLALAVEIVDGKVTSISGSIAAETYDAYGAAASALESANDYTDEAVAAAKKAILTGDSTTELKEAYDTLVEIQEWIEGAGVNATELTEAIAAEAKTREDADKELAQDIADEAATARAAEEQLGKDITAEAGRAAGEEARIEGLVTAEAAKAREEEGKLDAAIKAEAKTRGEEITRVEGLVSAEATTREEEDGKLAKAISDEAARADAEEKRIVGLVEAEAEAARAAEKKLGEDLAKEIQDRKDADQALQDQITALGIEDGKVAEAAEADHADVASSLDAAGVEQVKGIKVDAAGAADTATHADAAGKVDNALTVKLEDGTSVVYDGSAAKTVDLSAYATDAQLADAIAALDSSVAATAEADNQVSVLTGVTQTDGKLTDKTEVKLAAIAKTGNVNDLIQTTGDVLVFNCGTASTVI